MADEDDSEKTEDPSQKKLDDAHKRGEVPKSQEVPTFLMLLTAAILLLAMAPWSVGHLGQSMARIMAQAHDIPMDGGHLRLLTGQIAMTIVVAFGLPLVALVVVGAMGHLLQNPPVWSLDPIKPKFSKVSPLAGFKRLFSSESLVNFVKGLIKILAVGAAIWLVLWPQRSLVDGLISLEAGALLIFTRDLILKLLGAVLAVMLVVVIMDVVYQRFNFMKRQRMSMKELKEEFKQTEGSPEIKAKLRQIRQEKSRQRMMAAVPGATVVVTNPTHFAVALKYESGMGAPVCVAKGIDAVALRIRAVAGEANVPIVENPPLARLLHATVEIDQEIQPDQYKAVAQVIGYVMSLKAKARWKAE